MNANKDLVKFGLILGLLLPIVVMIIFFLFNIERYGNFNNFLSTIVKVNVYSELISLSVVPNLLLFFVFIWKHSYLSAKGVIFATMLYAFMILAFKFI